mgnify:CR=1 FL=1
MLLLYVITCFVIYIYNKYICYIYLLHMLYVTFVVIDGFFFFSGKKKKLSCQIACKSVPSALQLYHSGDFKISWAKSEN